MANWCSLFTTITLKNEKQASGLIERLDKTVEEKTLDFGGESFILYIHYSQNSNEIYISGDARWAFDHEDMCKFVDWLKQTIPIKDMQIKMDYEERGCEIYGKYVLEDGILGDCYLESEDIPEYPEINPDEDDEDEIDDMYMQEIYSRIEKSDPELVFDFNEEIC